MKKRVQWTEYEQDTLFSSIKDVFAKKPKLGLLEIAKLAQVALPTDRRRGYLNAIGNMPEYLRKKLIEANILATDWELKGRGSRSKPVDPNEARINQLADERDQALKLAVEHETVAKAARAEIAQLHTQLRSQPTEAEVIKKFIVDILAEVATRGRAIGSTLEPVPTPLPQPLPKHNPEPVQAERPKLPSILVVGGKTEQFQKIEKEFNGRAKFRHWRDGNYSMLEDQAKTSDIVYCMMGDVDHQAVSHVAHATDKFQRVQAYGIGPITSIIEGFLERRQREGK